MSQPGLSRSGRPQLFTFQKRKFFLYYIALQFPPYFSRIRLLKTHRNIFPDSGIVLPAPTVCERPLHLFLHFAICTLRTVSGSGYHQGQQCQFPLDDASADLSPTICPSFRKGTEESYKSPADRDTVCRSLRI